MATTHEERLRELAYHGLLADPHGHATAACLAGAEALRLLRESPAPVAAPPADLVATCSWTEDDAGVWHTGCGTAFFFDTDGPSELARVRGGSAVAIHRRGDGMTCACGRPKMQARSKACAGCRSARKSGQNDPAVPMKYDAAVWVKQQIQRREARPSAA